MNSNIAVPQTYLGNQDTGTVANLKLDQFFKDSCLFQLIKTARIANPDIQSALQRVEIAGANLQYSRSWLMPEVSFNASAGIEKFGDYTMNGVGNYDTNLSPNITDKQHIPNPTPEYFVGLRSSWEIDLWGKFHNKKKAAFTRFLASRSAYKLAMTGLTAQVATSYYQLLALDNESRIIEENITLQKNALEIIKIQKLGGRATELAVQQFQAQLARTQGLRYVTNQLITETENKLKFLTGKFNEPIKRDTSISSLKLPTIFSAGVPSQLLLNRPDIREAELELGAMNADIDAARKAFLPSLTISPYIGYNAFSTAVLFNPVSLVYGLLGGITAPIFNRKKIKSNYAKTVAEGKQALYNYQKVIFRGFMEVSNSLKGIDNYNHYYQFKKQEVKSLKNAVDVANDLFLVGRANYLEIITAQRNVLDAELELANTKKDIFLNAINLYRATGGGWK
ncbi:TolC family protein [Mucilaginibacter sp. 10I4]|uniref:TolC family protein n=1 Tax=Mucilaginibacter sp. 10I4 TaxID=3048580 RepID=UPI002B2353B6|nr:TolC family protein [Mucilaginibacter sp. 10I4]